MSAGMDQLPLACEIAELSANTWADRKPTMLIGSDARFAAALERTQRFAQSDAPVLITGETGTGKELFARAVHLLSSRRRRPYLAVNCAQYHEGPLMASELFGHVRGSFTGAIGDHRGVFEEGTGGTVFLDEIGELAMAAQAMLLRTLGEGEIVPVGGTHARAVDVRVVAATSRDLDAMVATGRFRADLYYRLNCMRLAVPAVRERGNDWEAIASYYLAQRCQRAPTAKRLSGEAKNVMRHYDWPGNVRELRSVVEMAFHLSAGELIEPADFAAELESATRIEQLGRVPVVAPDASLSRMIDHGESFWSVIYAPYMSRERSRHEVREVIAEGLARTRGSYKRLLPLFGIAATDYLKFMDFLRHQELKPQ